MIGALAVLAAFGARDRRTITDDDTVLVARHHAGDEVAFSLIYRAHVAAVYRRLSHILGPVPEREDLTQDVFLALHAALPMFRGDAKLTTLIHRIAINKAYEYLRRQSRRPAMLVETWFFDDMLSLDGSPELLVNAREELARVFACLVRIKPKKRIAFLLRVVEGLSFEEIGQLVDATPETVAKRVQHGQRELDTLLTRTPRSRA